MKISPLQLRQYFLTEISVRANNEFVGADSDEAGFDEDIGIGAEVSRAANPEDKRAWRVDLKIWLIHAESKRLPYNVQIAGTGIFDVSPGVPDDFVERLVSANGPAVLYGAMREVVAQLTRRGPNPALMLPSVTFIDDLAAKEKQAQANLPASKKRTKTARR
ncbi:MAG: protein-export chaperone SecB [Verrucomicrobiaceae bacterium]|nr:protein-export chaperone SecB [Verrucomicrobiaceae bacterium]